MRASMKRAGEEGAVRARVLRRNESGSFEAGTGVWLRCQADSEGTGP